MLVFMLISMLMSTDSVDFLFCLLFYLVINMLMLLVTIIFKSQSDLFKTQCLKRAND